MFNQYYKGDSMNKKLFAVLALGGALAGQNALAMDHAKRALQMLWPTTIADQAPTAFEAEQVVIYDDREEHDAVLGGKKGNTVGYMEKGKFVPCDANENSGYVVTIKKQNFLSAFDDNVYAVTLNKKGEIEAGTGNDGKRTAETDADLKKMVKDEAEAVAKNSRRAFSEDGKDDTKILVAVDDNGKLQKGKVKVFAHEGIKAKNAAVAMVKTLTDVAITDAGLTTAQQTDLSQANATIHGVWTRRGTTLGIVGALVGAGVMKMMSNEEEEEGESEEEAK